MAMFGPSRCLAERQQIADDVFTLTVFQAERRHEAARLDLPRVGHPAAEVLWGVLDNAGGQRLAAHQVRQVRRVAAPRGSAAYPMTVDARLAQEGGPPAPHVGPLH